MVYVCAFMRFYDWLFDGNWPVNGSYEFYRARLKKDESSNAMIEIDQKWCNETKYVKEKYNTTVTVKAYTVKTVFRFNYNVKTDYILKDNGIHLVVNRYVCQIKYKCTIAILQYIEK